MYFCDFRRNWNTGDCVCCVSLLWWVCGGFLGSMECMYGICWL